MATMAPPIAGTPEEPEFHSNLPVQNSSNLPRISDGGSSLEAIAAQSAPTMPAPGSMAIEQQRAIAETQAAMFVAKQFPRDLGDVLRRIQNTCSRKSVAEVAAYSYKRGSEEITGPTVYLLKAIAQEFGNITYGVRVLSTTPAFMGKPGSSTVEAFAWDMERNVREVRNFDVKHWRDTGSGGYAIKAERDVYELIANMGSRRVRACLEGVIPADIVEYAVGVCDRALVASNVTSPEFKAQLLAGFEEVGVTLDRIEARLNRKFEGATANQLLKLQRGLLAIKDGVTTADEAFPPRDDAKKSEAAPTGNSALRDRVMGKKATEAKAERETGEEG